MKLVIALMAENLKKLTQQGAFLGRLKKSGFTFQNKRNVKPDFLKI